MIKTEKVFSLGVIMLNTHFPRVLGDIGNPDSFAFDVHYARVASANVGAIVTANGVCNEVKKDIADTIQSLESKGVDLIVSTCGFLGEMQSELKDISRVPVLTSSLLCIPFVRTFLTQKSDKIAVLTFDANKLNPKHFGGHYGDDIIIGDIPKEGDLYTTIKEDKTTLDVQKAEQEVVSAVLNLVKSDSNIKAIVLECTNLSPYIDAIKSSVNLPVFDIMQTIQWFKQTKLG